MNAGSKKFALKLIGTQLLLTALMMTSFNAQAQRRGGGGRGHGPVGPTMNQGTEMKAAAIKQYMYQGEIIPVLKKLRLKQELNMGKKLLSINVKAHATSYNSKLIVLLNNQKVDVIQLSQYSQRHQLFIPSHSVINKLQIKIKGSAYVNNIVAKLERPITAQVVKAQLHQEVRGFTTLPIRKLVKEQNSYAQLKGKQLKKVILKAEPSGRGRRLATAVLLINGYQVGQSKTIGRSGNQNGKIVFYVDQYQNVIGQGIRSIKIEIQGPAFVKMVGLKVKDTYANPGRHGRRGHH